MLSYSQFGYQWKILLAETNFTQRLCICVHQTCHAWKHFQILYLPVCCCDGKHNIVISQSRLTKVQIGRKTNRWSSPPHQRRAASQMQMSHIQMHLLNAQNRWDLRAGANSPSKVMASVLRWRPRYDSPTAFGVHGWQAESPPCWTKNIRWTNNRDEVTKSDNKLYTELFWCLSNTVWHHHAPERKIMMQYLAITH